MTDSHDIWCNRDHSMHDPCEEGPFPDPKPTTNPAEVLAEALNSVDGDGYPWQPRHAARVLAALSPEVRQRVEAALVGEPPKAVKPCRWSRISAMSFFYCEEHGDYHRTFLTPPTICETAAKLSAEKGATRDTK